ncbi:MAG: HAD hydrolase-like protein [Actinomycetales bacterium]|nr:HAD hydrolase-like protein [Actinomycetales bacterium]
MTWLLAHDGPLAAAHDVALMDLDGVTYEGAAPIEYAAEGLAAARALGMRFVYVTNNSSRPPQEVSAQLVGLGIPATPEEVYSSAMAAVELAVKRHGVGARVLVVGGAGLVQASEEGGLVPVPSADDGPVAVLQGFRETICWKDLSEAAFAINRGADYIATNLDSTLPRERGMAVGNGSLVAAVVNATGVTPVSAGKPEPEIFRLASERVGARNPIAVGDRLNTDIAGAVASEVPSLHVLTGVSKARDVVLAVPGERPRYLGRDLRDLTRPHPPVVHGGEWVGCRAARARVVNGTLELGRLGVLTDAAKVTLDEYRALAVAAWSVETRVACPPIEVIESL